MNPIPELQPSQADDLRHRLVPESRVILRRASGYLELGELLLEGEAAAPPSACRLFRRALAELTQLAEADLADPAAALLEGESLRALGEWEAALPPLTRKSDGLPVGAVQGFCNMLWKLLKDTNAGQKPTHLAVIFDKSSKTFRNDIYPAL